MVSAEGETFGALLPSIIVEPTAPHHSSVIMLHGMYYDGTMFETLPAIFAQYVGERAAGTRFIFANAPMRTIDWPSGREYGVRSWYNYFTSKGGAFECDEIDLEQLTHVSREVHDLITREVEALGGDARRVAIGGNSQGGTVALHAAMTYPKGPVGALICGCTILMDQTPVDTSKAVMPVFIFVAEKDEEYAPLFQKKCFQRLRDAGFPITSHVEAGLSHYTESIAELHHTAVWLAKVFHSLVLEVRHRDVPEAQEASERTLFEIDNNAVHGH